MASATAGRMRTKRKAWGTAPLRSKRLRHEIVTLRADDLRLHEFTDLQRARRLLRRQQVHAVSLRNRSL